MVKTKENKKFLIQEIKAMEEKLGKLVRTTNLEKKTTKQLEKIAKDLFIQFMGME